MNLQNPNETSEVFSRYWPWFFFAAAFESLPAILALLLVPSENGVSPARLGLLGILAFFLVAGLILGFNTQRRKAQPKPYARPWLILLAALLALTAGLVLFLLRYLNPDMLLPYYERMSPLLWYLLVLGVQAALYLLIVRNGFHAEELSDRGPVIRSALVVAFFLFALVGLIALTKIGIAPDTAYWGEPGAAIQGWQAALAVLIGAFLLVGGLHISALNSPRISDIFIPVVIYVAACGLWLAVPVRVLENSFYAPITPPAYMPFPYSDAGFYDYLSQSLLIGTHYLGGIPPRPLYVVFLAGLHTLFGQNYPALIVAQTLVLALFPVALYFLGKKLHSPAAGATAALFAIFRELVSLWISSNTRVANSKIFTTDLPTALGIAILCLVVIRWFEKRDLTSTVLAGGSFGLLLLLRTQSLFILPVIFALAWLAYARRTRAWTVGVLVFVFALALAVLPWLVRNHAVSGRFSFDDPRQLAILYSQYSLKENLDVTQFDPERDSLADRIFSFTLANPAYVSRFVAAHFLNTEIGGLLALPLIKSFDGLNAPLNLYWLSWDGSLEWYNLALVLFYLAIIAVGLAAAWRRVGWVGVVPLAFNLGYALANGISRFSSWRYNLPVDWVVYFYFAIGTCEILYLLSSMLGAKIARDPAPAPQAGSRDISCPDVRPRHILLLLVFVLVGSIPWLAEGLARPRYTATHAELVTKLEDRGYPSGEIDAFLDQPGTTLLEGRILYPRLYRRNEGMVSANPWPAYAVREYARIGFVLLNEGQSNAIFITRDLLDFPQGADATVLGCQRDGYVEVRLIVFAEKGFQSAPLAEPCE